MPDLSVHVRSNQSPPNSTSRSHYQHAQPRRNHTRNRGPKYSCAGHCLNTLSSDSPYRGTSDKVAFWCMHLSLRSRRLYARLLKSDGRFTSFLPFRCMLYLQILVFSKFYNTISSFRLHPSLSIMQSRIPLLPHLPSSSALLKVAFDSHHIDMSFQCSKLFDEVAKGVYIEPVDRDEHSMNRSGGRSRRGGPCVLRWAVWMNQPRQDRRRRARTSRCRCGLRR